MAKIEWNRIPKFAQLPVRADAPAQASWGVFGEDDQLGCLNFLTPQGVIAAAGLVKKGSVFRLDAPIGFAVPPSIREPVKHTIRNYFDVGFSALDDVLDNYNTQEGSQWDGLKHVGHTRLQAFYNGATVEDVKQNRKLGVENWKDRIIGRGLLIDVYRHCTETGRSIDPLQPEKYSVDELKDALKAQGSRLKPGSVVLVRTGWMQAYLGAPAEVKQAMGALENVRACGLDASREMAAWLWDNRVAAIGTDTFAVEAFPFDFQDEGTLHIRALPLLGLSLGEQFNLEELAADCAQDKRYEFMLVSVPLHVIGGYASPPNAVAIK
jgi:kynurenine formamidase